MMKMAAIVMALNLAAATHIVWPPPRSITATGPPLGLSASLTIASSHQSVRLARAMARTSSQLRTWANQNTHLSSAASLSTVNVEVTSPTREDDVGVSEHTAYNYSVHVNPTGIQISAPSIYGAMYGLESLTQLVDATTGMVLVRHIDCITPFALGHALSPNALSRAPPSGLQHEHVSIEDAPEYTWRGLMVDSGRRFFPMALLEDLLDTMGPRGGIPTQVFCTRRAVKGTRR